MAALASGSRTNVDLRTAPFRDDARAYLSIGRELGSSSLDVPALDHLNALQRDGRRNEQFSS
jgi:hypothetical protein